MNKKMFAFVMMVVVGALVVSAFSWAAITRFNESQRALTGDLASLNADEASAYRWDAIARFYNANNSQAGDLTKYYISERSSYGGIPAFENNQQGMNIYHNSEWNSFVKVPSLGFNQKGMDLYHQSEWNSVSVQGMAFHYTSPGR
jgi:hypothetical protein